MTEILSAPEDVVLISQGNNLPVPHDLDPPSDNFSSRLYYESLEAMSIKMDSALVVGPTDLDDRTWLVTSGAGFERVFQDDPQGTGR